MDFPDVWKILSIKLFHHLLLFNSLMYRCHWRLPKGSCAVLECRIVVNAGNDSRMIWKNSYISKFSRKIKLLTSIVCFCLMMSVLILSEGNDYASTCNRNATAQFSCWKSFHFAWTKTQTGNEQPQQNVFQENNVWIITFNWKLNTFINFSRRASGLRSEFQFSLAVAEGIKMHQIRRAACVNNEIVMVSLAADRLKM